MIDPIIIAFCSAALVVVIVLLISIVRAQRPAPHVAPVSAAYRLAFNDMLRACNSAVAYLDNVCAAQGREMTGVERALCEDLVEAIKAAQKVNGRE